MDHADLAISLLDMIATKFPDIYNNRYYRNPLRTIFLSEILYDQPGATDIQSIFSELAQHEDYLEELATDININARAAGYWTFVYAAVNKLDEDAYTELLRVLPNAIKRDQELIGVLGGFAQAALENSDLRDKAALGIAAVLENFRARPAAQPNINNIMVIAAAMYDLEAALFLLEAAPVGTVRPHVEKGFLADIEFNTPDQVPEHLNALVKLTVDKFRASRTVIYDEINEKALNNCDEDWTDDVGLLLDINRQFAIKDGILDKNELSRKAVCILERLILDENAEIISSFACATANNLAGYLLPGLKEKYDTRQWEDEIAPVLLGALFTTTDDILLAVAAWQGHSNSKSFEIAKELLPRVTRRLSEQDLRDILLEKYREDFQQLQPSLPRAATAAPDWFPMC